MRVSKEKSEENKLALLQAASELFREKGIDGVGVAEVAKAAGLTHGALYAHFPSKDVLVAAAFAYGFEKNLNENKILMKNKTISFDEQLASLFSIETRDRLETGCPMTASASEVARQGVEVSANFKDAFEKTVAIVEKTLSDTLTKSKRRQLAVATVAAQIGAIGVSRAIFKSDSELAEDVLKITKKSIHKVFQADSASS